MTRCLWGKKQVAFFSPRNCGAALDCFRLCHLDKGSLSEGWQTSCRSVLQGNVEWTEGAVLTWYEEREAE